MYSRSMYIILQRTKFPVFHRSKLLQIIIKIIVNNMSNMQKQHNACIQISVPAITGRKKNNVLYLDQIVANTSPDTVKRINNNKKTQFIQSRFSQVVSHYCKFSIFYKVYTVKQKVRLQCTLKKVQCIGQSHGYTLNENSTVQLILNEICTLIDVYMMSHFDRSTYQMLYIQQSTSFETKSANYRDFRNQYVLYFCSQHIAQKSEQVRIILLQSTYCTKK
eukprot:TRINITY_DN2662_c0_g1_i4.p1 TRINITY_DN2662_c0_g1~~TRINITY_DN2662_c0_g1_i4.p1  ORF type:complete len:220 (+),score=-16.63 TRINITY_DN2662_c0_g1_i4:572-1231(+)